MKEAGIPSLAPHMQFVASLGMQEYTGKTADSLANLAGSADLMLSSDAHSYGEPFEALFREAVTSYVVRRKRQSAIRIVSNARGAEALDLLFWAESPEIIKAVKPERPGLTLSPESLEGVEFTTKTLLQINQHGLAADVQTVISGIRRYFAEATLGLEWVEGQDSARPVAISIDVDYGNDEWAAEMDAFEGDWWLKQDVALHESVGVHLA